jgi:hypothetical protein
VTADERIRIRYFFAIGKQRNFLDTDGTEQSMRIDKKGIRSVAIADDIQWIEFVNPDLSDFNSGTWSRAQEIQAHSLDFGLFDPELAKALVPRFLNLTGEDKASIYLASDRFARALWRTGKSEARMQPTLELASQC